MTKKFWLSTLVIFVLAMATDFVLHGLILKGDYGQLPNLMRTEADSQHYIGWMILAHVLISGAFVWIYQRGREDKPFLSQGLRFGFVIALLTVVPTYLIYYVVEPMPGLLVAKQIGFDLLRTLILGVVVAGMNK